MILSDWDLPIGSPRQVTVTVTYPQPVSNITLAYCIDDGTEVYTWMEPTDRDETTWTRTIQLGTADQHVQFAVRTGGNEEDGCNSVFSWPLYGLPTATYRRVAAPTARRSAWSFHADDLEVLNPIRYTPFLWSLPLRERRRGTHGPLLSSASVREVLRLRPGQATDSSWIPATRSS